MLAILFVVSVGGLGLPGLGVEPDQPFVGGFEQGAVFQQRARLAEGGFPIFGEAPPADEFQRAAFVQRVDVCAFLHQPEFRFRGIFQRQPGEKFPAVEGEGEREGIGTVRGEVPREERGKRGVVHIPRVGIPLHGAGLGQKKVGAKCVAEAAQAQAQGGGGVIGAGKEEGDQGGAGVGRVCTAR